jgi:hypothetical protein
LQETSDILKERMNTAQNIYYDCWCLRKVTTGYLPLKNQAC